MKRAPTILILFHVVAGSVVFLHAQGTAFTYQGRLNDNGAPATAIYDLRFTIYDAAANGNVSGGPVTSSTVGVTNGLFTVLLDFGAGIFTGPPRWLEIGVRPAGSGSFTTLTSRQPITPAPYAITAENANNLSGVRVQQNTNGAPNVIGGAPVNFVTPGVIGATIGGGGVANYFGSPVTNSVTADFGTVGGGSGNTADQGGTVAGGFANTAGGPAATAATVGGGFNNTASGPWATVAGGSDNTASGPWATVAGGSDNSVSGVGSFAAGDNCNVPTDHSFMWSDGTLSFTSFTDNGFYALATGGYYLFSGNSVGVQITPGGNAWSGISDRNVKENFEPVDCKAVLEKVVALPVTTWNLKTQPPEIRHIGAMAQDFKAAFAVGDDDRHISTSDADGVALAAIQGLNQKLTEELKHRDAENAELKRSVAELEQRIKALAERFSESAR
jgi:hypothetical protein